MRATWEDWKWGSSQRHIPVWHYVWVPPPPPRGLYACRTMRITLNAVITNNTQVISSINSQIHHGVPILPPCELLPLHSAIQLQNMPVLCGKDHPMQRKLTPPLMTAADASLGACDLQIVGSHPNRRITRLSVNFSILRFSIISIVDSPLNILWNYQFLIWCNFCVIITFIESCYFILS